MDILCAGTSTSATQDYAGIYADTVHDVLLERVNIYQAVGGPRFNTGVHIVNCRDWNLIDNCRILGKEEGVWFDTSAVLTLTNSVVGAVTGTGFGAVRLDTSSNNVSGAGVATLNMTNVLVDSSDWGIYLGPCVNTHSPSFIYLSNVQINLPQVGGIYCGTGSQFWAEYVWISFDGGGAGVGIHFGTSYSGWAYILNSVIQSPSLHGIEIDAGNGFVISSTSFGACGNAAPGTYDDIHIGNGVSNVTISECHFDTDYANNTVTSRSAVWIGNSGVSNVLLTANIAASSGYGMSALVDPAGVATKGANINL